MKIVVVSGGFDPLHSGHIAYFRDAKRIGDTLVVGVNSDDWLKRKKGRAFMSWYDRSLIIQHLKEVNFVIQFDDSDGSAIRLLDTVKKTWPKDEIIFANGGDRTKDNIPEMSVEGVEFVFGVGGENKMNSSSWILDEWKAPKTERPWGYYRVLHEVSGMKVKELTVEPGKSLSLQRHRFRREHWTISEGACVVHRELNSGYALPAKNLQKHQTIDIEIGEWHQLKNPFNEPCRIVEIQYGEKCEEEDIERK
jgi:cytidyltransferase-like protein